MYKIPAVIFAGGKSSRMQCDKALLPFGGYKTLSEFQYTKLQRYFETVYMSAKSNKFDFDVEVILDTSSISSPLIGLQSLFTRYPQEEAFFILSVDTPQVNQEVIEHMVQAYYHNPEADVIVAETKRGIEPLCGIYRATIYPYLQEAIEKEYHKLLGLLQRCDVSYLFFEDETLFVNLNYKETYEEILAQIASTEHQSQ